MHYHGVLKHLDGDTRREYKRLVSIIMLFRSLPGDFFVFEKGGVYLPPSTTKNYHPNHKPDPEFPIYIETKSACGGAAENKQPEHPRLLPRNTATFAAVSKFTGPACTISLLAT